MFQWLAKPKASQRHKQKQNDATTAKKKRKPLGLKKNLRFVSGSFLKNPKYLMKSNATFQAVKP
jgi:hypothetical protein